MVGARIYPDDRLARDAAVADSAAELREDVREAYERGRKDERALRRRHPIAMTFTFAAALVGAGFLALAAINGSFAGAGGVVDQNLTVAVNRAGPQVRDAASQAGQSLKDAGSQVKAKATS